MSRLWDSMRLVVGPLFGYVLIAVLHFVSRRSKVAIDLDYMLLLAGLATLGPIVGLAARVRRLEAALKDLRREEQRPSSAARS
jgi:hypothetical protein